MTKEQANFGGWERVGNSISLQPGPGALVPGGGWVGGGPRVPGALGGGTPAARKCLLPTLSHPPN